MPSPRAGIAMVRESSSHTTAQASTDMPPPPYSTGTSSCQMPSSLARCSKRSRYSGLMYSPSVVCRSIGIISLSTKRRSPALRMRNSSGNSKSIPSLPSACPGKVEIGFPVRTCATHALNLPPQHAHVDRERAAPRRADDQRIDLDIGHSGAVIEIELRERQGRGSERSAIGGRSATKTGQQRCELEPIDHRADIG